MIFQFKYKVATLNQNTLNIKYYNTPAYFAFDVHAHKENYYFIWENQEDLLEITKIDLINEQTITNNLMQGFGFFSTSNVKITNNESDEMICTGNFDGQLTSIKFDSNLDEIDRFNIGVTENFGLVLNTPDSWKIDNGMIYSQQSRELHILDNEEVRNPNELQYHPSPILKDRQVFGFVNIDYKTYFTKYDIDTDSLSKVYELPLSPEHVPFELYALDDKIYQLKSDDKLIEYYPNPSSAEIQIPYEIQNVHHQSNDKILVTVEIDNEDKLAWYDGQQFELVFDKVVGRVELETQSWKDDSSIKMILFNTDSGLTLFSFDEQSGEQYLLEDFEMGLNSYSLVDQTSNNWKLVPISQEKELLILATNGKKKEIFNLDQTSTEVGWSFNIIYENEHLFLTNFDNESFSINQEMIAVNLSDKVDNKFIEEVIFIEDRYYIIASDLAEIVIWEADLSFSTLNELARLDASTCRYNDYIQYLGQTSDNELLLTIPTYDHGYELWSLSLETNQVNLIEDLDQSSFRGFAEVQFYNDGHFYFTGRHEGRNIQMYRIESDNSLVATKDLLSHKNNVVIHPNPTEQFISFNSPLKAVKMYNAQGVLVYESQHSELITTLDLGSSLAQGIYYLMGTDQNGQVLRSSFVKI